ncbi:unnamed protein product [Sphagnum balticum]
MKLPFDVVRAELVRVLVKHGFDVKKANQLATIFTQSSCDGVYSHGLNRFPNLVKAVTNGLVDIHADPILENKIGQIEQWNGNRGPGALNACFCMDRAIELAKANGIGCVAIRNTNHWDRGGTYGWQAANAGTIGICFTNTGPNLPPWGGIDPRLGNNPLVIAIPRRTGHIVLDMSISQYSYGKLHEYQAKNEQLPFPGGYDSDGKLTTDAASIINSKRSLPIGLWKGSGLSLVLDLLVTILSQAQSTAEITEIGISSNISQVFICIYQPDTETTQNLIEQTIAFMRTSRLEKDDGSIMYPGENSLKTREKNLKEGIPVDEKIWNSILEM